MDLSFHGANAIALSTKKAKLIFDPVVPGLPVKTDKYDVIVVTHDQEVKPKGDQLLINTPGEYEAREVSLKGIAARAHMDEEDKQSATMYRVYAQGIRLAFTGHIYPQLTGEQLEQLGTIDVLVIPVGGNGYTLDDEGAARIVRAIEPKVVIPTHYADKQIKYEVPQIELKQFLDEIGAPMTEEETKYKAKDGMFPEQLTVINLKRTA